MGLRRECIGNLRMEVREGLTGLVAEQVAPVAVSQVKNHPRFKYFRDSGDAIYLIGPLGNEMGASQYLSIVHGRKEGLPPRLSYELELGELIEAGLLKSAHDRRWFGRSLV